MKPMERYDLAPGEWRPDPPHIGYGADREGLVEAIRNALRPRAWSVGTSDAGPDITVGGLAMSCPPTPEDLTHLETLATPAPYGRGEDTILDAKVRDARQIDAEHMTLEGAAWTALKQTMLTEIATRMGLEDTKLSLVPLKLLIYERGGHFADHADTEKHRGMIASAALIVPSTYTGGTLVVENDGKTLKYGTDGASEWRWIAWYADCRHRLKPVRDGVRMSITFAVCANPDGALVALERSPLPIRRALWARSTPHHETDWAARGGRTRAGDERYGQKCVWVLSHRYTEAGLRANLLKGADRMLARIVLDTPHEQHYLGWLEVRETGSAATEQPGHWATDEWGGNVEVEPDDDLPPPSLSDEDLEWSVPQWEYDPAAMRIAHRQTPELHIESVERQHIWIEGLRTLDGTEADFGPIEVLDGEIVPAGALDQTRPTGARVYEATGNEGASLELQYRAAVLVHWRRNDPTLRMLARCGGRRALGMELKQRRRAKERDEARALLTVLALWREARETDDGGPEPMAHQIVLEAVSERQGRERGGDERWRNAYIEKVAAADLDAAAVPSLIAWLKARLAADTPIDAWIETLRPTCAAWPRSTMSGAPMLLRTLAQDPKTVHIAIALLGEADRVEQQDAQSEAERLDARTRRLEVQIEEEAWYRRRRVRMTEDSTR